MFDLERYRKIRVVPLTGMVGAEIFDVDVTRIDDQTFAEIRQAFHDHVAIVFRDQQLDKTGLAEFAGRFSPLIPADGKWQEGKDLVGRMHRAAHVPATVRNLGDRWHADKGSHEEPNMAAALYCLEAPPYGGDTLFSSLYAAYDALSPDLRAFCDTLIARHSPPLSRRAIPANLRAASNVPEAAGRGTGNEAAGLDYEALPSSVEHPVVCIHPETGRRFLYVTGDHMVGIKGMADGEAQPILDMLKNHATRPEFTCRLRWRPGSLAIWDNRCGLHYAVNDYAGFARTMLRCEMKGTRPFGSAMPRETALGD